MVSTLSLALHNYFKFNLTFSEQEIDTLNKIGQILKELYTQGDIYRDEIKKIDLQKEIFEERKFFTLIHGDFSGIQQFIHLISSKYAMKTLKGRSFFFGLLTENFAQYIVDKLDLILMRKLENFYYLEWDLFILKSLLMRLEREE